MKKAAIVFLLCLSLAAGLVTAAFAVEMKSEHEYKPLDLVVVLDNSGSMKYSDPEKTALSAVRMLVNMMPAADSRVCVIGFNTDPIPLTADGAGKAALIPLDAFSGLETVRDSVKAENVPYKGDTGIGNALNAAREVLASQSDSSHAAAVILFTDGVDDFESTPTEQLRQTRLAACEENEAKTVQWARQSGCPVYCLGYDYAMAGGQSSMGADGAGLKKLQSIAESTGGKYCVIHSIRDMELMMIDFLADVCDLNYKEVVTIPGDGGEHECTIPVSANVVEANIRIAGGSPRALADGEIRLFDPAGKEIPLRNSGNVRFDIDVAAASIKVIMPKPGEWRLAVRGIQGEDIHVGLLEHFRMNLASEISFPAGNPEGVAYSNDELGVRAWLTFDGSDLTDSDLYDAVTSAKVILVSRQDPNDRTEIPLTLGEHEFTGSFVIPEDSVYDVTIRLDWDTVYREDTVVIHSSNRPLEPVGTIGDVRVNKNKTASIDNIFQYVRDDENDPITAEITLLSGADRADVSIRGDQLSVTGKKHGSTVAAVRFTDKQGNTVESDFRIKVVDPLVWVGLGGAGLLIIAAVIGLICWIRRLSNRIKGKMRVVFIAKGVLDPDGKYSTQEIVYENPNVASFDPHMIDDDQILTNAPPPQGDPFAGGADPFFGGECTFAASADPFADSADLFASGADPFADCTDPFAFAGFPTGAAPEPTGGGAAEAPLFDDWLWEAPSAADQAMKAEKAHSDQFDEKLPAGGSGHRSKTMDTILRRFLAEYGSFMQMRDPNSPLARRVTEFSEATLLPQLSHIVMQGTPMGRSGFRMKADKRALNHSLIVESPVLTKRRADVSFQKPFRIKISVPTGRDGDLTQCAHIEIEYTKN